MVAGCQTQAPHIAAVKDLIDADTAFANAASVEGAAQAFKEFAAPNGMSLPQGENPIIGQDNIFEHMRATQGKLTWAPRGGDISHSDDLGYTWGEYRYIEPAEDGTTKPPHFGKYLTVWKRQPDGTWKFIADIGNSSPAPN